MNSEKKSYLLSLIIPVFNRRKSISVLLGKLMKYLPDSVEILVIDDGSTDNTLGAINDTIKYSPQADQIKVIQHGVNSGVSIARNTGLEQASGYYIGFIDSDDDIVKNYFESLMPIISELKYDIISFDFLYEDKIMKPSNDTDNIEDVFSVSYWHLFSRIYKKELWTNERFEPSRRYEDVILLPYIYIKAKVIKHIPNVLYIYNRTDVSITQKIKESDIDDLFFAMDKAIYFIENKASDNEAKLFLIYSINVVFLIRKYIKKTYGYYSYDERFYNITHKIIRLIKKYSLNVSSIKIKKIEYLALDSFFSKLKYKLQRKRR